jgi:hypothetical protein
LIPTPIRQVLSTIQTNGVQALLMGGQACVFYGAAQVSRDVDLVLLAQEENFSRLLTALANLDAKRIAVPRFDPALLERGHAVHYRCAAPGVEDLRIDIMTRLRDLPSFAALWERRTVIIGDRGEEFHLLSIPDLVNAKKTQRTKDWPIIELLVAIHYRENVAAPLPEWVAFWLRQARTPELLEELVQRFPEQARAQSATRPLLHLAFSGESEALRQALDTEARAEQAKDRAYWAPLKAELEVFRRAEREGS